MQQEDRDGAQLEPESDSAHNNPSNNSNAKGGTTRANESVDAFDGGGVSGGVGASNGTRSVGHPKIGGQAPAASVGVGGEPAKTEATPRCVLT